MNCPLCQKRVPARDVYCAYCGTRLALYKNPNDVIPVVVAVGWVKRAIAGKHALARRLLLLVCGLGAMVFALSYLRSCASTIPALVVPASVDAGSPGKTSADQTLVPEAAEEPDEQTCAETVAIDPPIKATPVSVSAGKGRLGIDFAIIGVRPCGDSFRFYIIVKRNINRTLTWRSDRPRMSRIYLLSSRKRFKLVDLGGIFVENVTMQPQQAYEGWIEFERPSGTVFTLVYPDIEPLQMNLNLP